MIENDCIERAGEETEESNAFSLGKIERFEIIIRLILRRSFPYMHYFIVTFPFFVLLISNNVLLEKVLSISYLFPFLFALMAMYAYNEISDCKIDPCGKNLITSGRMLKNDVLLLTIFSVLCAIISAIAIYRSIVTITVFYSYIFFCLAYSGIKIRFKTTLAGPFVASYILWVGPSLILLTEFSFWNPISISFLLGIFLIFSAHEIHHQIDDYIGDKKFNVRTLSVRIGPKKALLTSSIVSIFGFICILYSMYYSVQYLYFVLFMGLIFLFILFQSILASRRSVLVTVNIPVKVILITFGCIILGVSSFLTLLILMVFFAEIYARPCAQYYTISNLCNWQRKSDVES